MGYLLPKITLTALCASLHNIIWDLLQHLFYLRCINHTSILINTLILINQSLLSINTSLISCKASIADFELKFKKQRNAKERNAAGCSGLHGIGILRPLSQSRVHSSIQRATDNCRILTRDTLSGTSSCGQPKCSSSSPLSRGSPLVRTVTGCRAAGWLIGRSFQNPLVRHADSAHVIRITQISAATRILPGRVAFWRLSRSSRTTHCVNEN